MSRTTSSLILIVPMRYVGSRVGPVRALFYFPYIFPLSSFISHFISTSFQFISFTAVISDTSPFEIKASMRGSRRVRRTIRVLIPSRFRNRLPYPVSWFADPLFHQFSVYAALPFLRDKNAYLATLPLSTPLRVCTRIENPGSDNCDELGERGPAEDTLVK